MLAVDSNINVKEWTGVHNSLEVSIKINNMLGKQIIVGQLIK
jgi:hypothetical protein